MPRSTDCLLAPDLSTGRRSVPRIDAALPAPACTPRNRAASVPRPLALDEYSSAIRSALSSSRPCPQWEPALQSRRLLIFGFDLTPRQQPASCYLSLLLKRGHDHNIPLQPLRAVNRQQIDRPSAALRFSKQPCHAAVAIPSGQQVPPPLIDLIKQLKIPPRIQPLPRLQISIATQRSPRPLHPLRHRQPPSCSVAACSTGQIRCSRSQLSSLSKSPRSRSTS